MHPYTLAVTALYGASRLSAPPTRTRLLAHNTCPHVAPACRVRANGSLIGPRSSPVVVVTRAMAAAHRPPHTSSQIARQGCLLNQPVAQHRPKLLARALAMGRSCGQSSSWKARVGSTSTVVLDEMGIGDEED